MFPRPLTCLEICAGAGGQALGLALAGFVHVGLVEYEEAYCQVLKANRPEWPVISHIWHHENRFSRNGHYKPILTRHGGVRPTKA